jgi:hypothetical protein
MIPTSYVGNGDRVLLLSGRIPNQDFQVWLCVEALNGKDWHFNGFDPSTTRITSYYRPYFRKDRISGLWEIAFFKEQ